MARKAKKNPVGRPPKEEGNRKRNILSMRVRDELRSMLAAQAETNQRSLSEEAEARLERTFREREIAESILRLASLDQHTIALVMMLTRAIRDAGSYAGFISTNKFEGSVGWMSNPYAFQQVEEAIGTILAGLRPEGEIRMPKQDEEIVVGLGRRFAAGILEAITNPDRFGEIGTWARPIREKLGESVVARIRFDEPTINIAMGKQHSDGATTLFATLSAKGRKNAG
jgi:hypothetical protein